MRKATLLCLIMCMTCVLVSADYNWDHGCEKEAWGNVIFKVGICIQKKLGNNHYNWNRDTAKFYCLSIYLGNELDAKVAKYKECIKKKNI